jgi:mevalonate kinase
MLLVDTGKPGETTKQMIEQVAGREDKEEIIKKIGIISKEMRIKLVKGEQIGDLIDQNGLLLEELGVVGEKVRKLTRELRNVGAKVKITGAGGVKSGSGMMLVFHQNLEKIGGVLDNKQIDYWQITIGGE